MDFLKKAKASLKDLEGDLNKATSALGLNNKDGPTSTNTTTASTAMNTPATSVAPSTAMNTPSTSVAPSVAAEVPKAKLPLAVRKSVRDDWETPKPELEAKISALMGVPWSAPIDIPMVFSYATAGFAKENTGQMLATYIEETTKNIETYINKFGQEGKTELNQLAFNHTIVLEPTEDKKISTCGCDISNGSLRILFATKYLSYNISQATEDIAQAVNAAGIASSSASGGEPMDFDAKSSIRSDYEPQIGEVQAKLQKILAMPVLTLTPNFEHNFAAVSKHAKAGGSSDLVREWQKRFGHFTLSYFDGLAHQLENAGFGKDEMLQEGLQEAVEKNEIQLRVVDKLAKKTYHDCSIENGVLVVQTVPRWWGTNTSQVGEDTMDLL